MQYAVIENGAVVNVIWLDPRNAADFPDAVPVGDVAAGIGDGYADGAFWRDGARLLTPPEAAQATIATLDAAVLDLEYQNALLALGLS
ncbi:MAG: hypothetical protein VB104_04845 [Candidatus Limiplasma sp.]|nr:hypothetical protein [Candidatus Limiplasma sp.]